MTSTALNLDLLQAMVESLPADGLAPVRRDALARFAVMGFPTVREEDWKYTSLSVAAEIGNAWLREHVAEQAGVITPLPAGPVAVVRNGINAHWIVLRDGLVDAEFLKGVGKEIRGVTFSRIVDEDAPELTGDDAMSVFNQVLLRDGLRIKSAPGAAPSKPIGILYVDSPSSAVTQTRVIVEAGENSHLRIIECCLSAESGRQFTNSVMETTLERGARLDHVRIQYRDSTHVGLNRVTARLDRNAGFRHNSFDLGGALTRNDVTAEISGPGASVSLDGLYLASGDQHIDNHTCIVHGVGPSASTEEYRGILAGRSRCVFNGKVTVSAGADGTDSRQSNHNLLLSDRAEIDTKPELEIYADDVKCAHGATVGQLDNTALFYLRSRGLDKDQARQVLTRAFAAGTLSALAIEECRDYLAGLLDERLEALVGEQP